MNLSQTGGRHYDDNSTKTRNRGRRWEFLWGIGKKSKRGRVLDFRDLQEPATPDTIPKLKSRLLERDEFPVDLGDLISAADGNARLELLGDRIRIFETCERTTLVEFSGWSPARPIWER